MINKKYSYIAFALIIIINLLLTIFSSNTYERTLTERMDCNDRALYNHLLNVKDKHKFRSEIDSVIVEKRLPGGVKKWTEYHKNGMVLSFEHDSIVKPDRIYFKLLSSTKGVTGNWMFEVKPEDESHSFLTITENGTIEGFFNKWIYTLLGKEAMIKREMNTIKEIIEKSNARKRNPK